jgi:hypothetical protein
MSSFTQVSLLVAAVALLPACGKKEAEPLSEKSTAAAPAAQSPFQRNGEMLTVNVDGMPRQAFMAKLTELTGTKITAEGDNNQLVTVHAVDVSLRKVLSMAIADAPYSTTMTYTNLQDSFPASVTVGKYQAGRVGALQQNGQQQKPPHGAMRQPVAAVPPGIVSQPVAEEPAGPDFSSMTPDEQMAYFMGQPTDDQVSIIFDMEPTAQDSELMTRLMAKEELASEVKIEMLDSLSTGEYENSAPAIKTALGAADPEVATKAVEVLAELGSDKDIPALKALAEKNDNEEVRTAVNDAIEALQP